MTLKDIALKNLKRRKAKAGFVFIGLLIAVSSVVAFVTLIESLTHDINTKLEQYGANILIVPKTENLSLNYGGLAIGGVMYEMQEIQQKELRKIRTIKNSANVAAVGPMVLGAVDVSGKKVLLAGMDFGEVPMLRPWWIPQGQFPVKEQVLAGSEAARVLGLVHRKDGRSGRPLLGSVGDPGAHRVAGRSDLVCSSANGPGDPWAKKGAFPWPKWRPFATAARSRRWWSRFPRFSRGRR